MVEISKRERSRKTRYQPHQRFDFNQPYTDFKCLNKNGVGEMMEAIDNRSQVITILLCHTIRPFLRYE